MLLFQTIQSGIPLFKLVPNEVFFLPTDSFEATGYLATAKEAGKQQVATFEASWTRRAI
jgi:hypothetical protein